VTVRDTAVQTVIDIAGQVFPRNSAIIYSQVPGRVDTIKADPGDRVRVNDVVAVVMQDIPGSEFRPYRVKAPISGVVLRKLTDVGNYVSVQNPLFEIGDISCLFIRGQVFGEERALVKSGQTIAITDERHDTIAVVAVTLVSPQVDPVTGGLTVESRVCKTAKTASELKPGQTVNGHIIAGSKNGLRVPRISVITTPEKGTGVFAIDNGIARFKPVRISARSEEFFLITGIQDGALIAHEGADRLSDGQRVSINKD
jgi:multidrug efflux pump subunit AcrA (membrane-fusion protein)